MWCRAARCQRPTRPICNHDRIQCCRSTTVYQESSEEMTRKHSVWAYFRRSGTKIYKNDNVNHFGAFSVFEFARNIMITLYGEKSLLITECRFTVSNLEYIPTSYLIITKYQMCGSRKLHMDFLDKKLYLNEDSSMFLHVTSDDFLPWFIRWDKKPHT